MSYYAKSFHEMAKRTHISAEVQEIVKIGITDKVYLKA